MQAVREIMACRLCDHEGLTRIVDFGKVALGNNLQETAKGARDADTYPLELHRCGLCGHFQLGHAVSPEILYATNYTYLSGIGPSFVRHFAEYAQWMEQTCDLPRDALIVDVGSNDGTALKAFKARGFSVCGVDPASMPAQIANKAGIPTLNTFFDDTAVREIIASHGRADLVTSHNVLAHVDDLQGTFRAIYSLLNDGGYFCFEVGYFREVLSKNCFDTIYHEHLDYHHAAPLVNFLMKLGFSVEQLSVNAIQGGSVRLLFRKDDRQAISEQAEAFLAAERQSLVNDAEFLSTWRERLQCLVETFRKRLRDHRDRGSKIAAYGAPTKATLLMKVTDLSGEDIAFVVEDNPLKTGRFLPGSGVAILPTTQLQADTPDVLVVFAWNFAEDIIAKVRGSYDKPIEVIVPLPELRVESL